MTPSVTRKQVTQSEMKKENNKLDMDYRTEHPVRLLSLVGVSRYLSCSGDLIEELISMGSFPVVHLSPAPKTGKRDRRKRWVDIKDLDSFIEAQKNHG